MNLNDLTRRQRQVAERIARRETGPEIAEALACKVPTVRTHVSAIARRIRDKHPELRARGASRLIQKWFRTCHGEQAA